MDYFQCQIPVDIEKAVNCQERLESRGSERCKQEAIPFASLYRMKAHPLDTISSTTPQHPYIWMELHNGIAAALRMQTGELEGTRLSRSVRICM